MPKTSPSQRVLQLAQTMVDLEQKIEHLEYKVQEYDAVREEAREDIDSFPDQTFELDPQSIRSKLNQYIRTYSRRKCLNFAYVWHRLYEAILYRRGINVHVRAENKKISFIQTLDDLDMMEYAYNLAREIFPL